MEGWQPEHMPDYTELIRVNRCLNPPRDKKIIKPCKITLKEARAFVFVDS